MVRDKRRIDPVTGQVRVPPASEQSAGGGVHVDEATGRHAADTQASSAELDALRAQLDERTGDVQRISAEYSNYRRRVERDRQLVIAIAKAQVVSQLLAVVDDIERAEEHGDLSGVFKAVADKLVSTLRAQGLEPFGATGDGFDPAVHEAVHHSTSPEVHTPTVTAVLRCGYRFGDRVLRPAMVAVTDASSDTVPSGDAGPSDDAGSSGDAGPSGDAEPVGDAEPFGSAEQLQDN
ncbi:MAG: nucleotide exchange factor GrpE [Pseudonocardiales bacterium]|nr:nucleotide exchange factor GrpE [Pseudonocardiales bacterium]